MMISHISAQYSFGLKGQYIINVNQNNVPAGMFIHNGDEASVLDNYSICKIVIAYSVLSE